MRRDSSIDATLRPSSDNETLSPGALSPSRPQIDLRLSLVRDGTLLPFRSSSHPREQIPLAQVLEIARGVEGQEGCFLVGGGDPMRRTDFWELLAALIEMRPDNFGICTPGHGVSRDVATRLRQAGVRRVHVPFHCARQDANDWLVGESGALKHAHRAIRACVQADLTVAAEIVLTRPTVLQLSETVEVLARLGVGTVNVRRLSVDDVDATTFVPLSPRISLLGPPLELAAAAALPRKVRLSLRDIPLCAAPRLRPLFAGSGREAWIQTDGTLRTRQPSSGCTSCPGMPLCAGAPPDYVARFGWTEFVDPASTAGRIAETVKEQQVFPRSQPMHFAWRGPHRVRCETCGDASDERWNTQSYESTRIIRARMVEAARHRPSMLRLSGADLLAHPEAALLIYDAVRLFPHVEVAGEASAVVDWSDLDLRRLKDLKRFDVVLYGPDAATHDAHCGIPGAFAATLRGAELVRTKTEAAVGAYAILHDASTVPAFAEAWAAGLLPGEPRFRLSPRGASLDELLERASALPAGPARAALLAVLPRCMREPLEVEVDEAALAPEEAWQTIQCGRSIPYQPGGSDPIGVFDTCPHDEGRCARSGCSGMAIGWQSTTRSRRWTASI